MNGSKKQIIWALEIKSKISEVLDNIIKLNRAYVEAHPEAYEAYNKMVNTLDETMKAIEETQYAGDIIDVFCDTHFSGDNKKDYMSIVSQCSLHQPLNDRQEKIVAPIKKARWGK